MKVVNGVLTSTKAGDNNKEVRAFGVNYFDVFIRMLEDPTYTDYTAGFAELSQFNVAFVRFPLGYWPNECSLYQTDKVAFFSKLTTIFNEAELNGIGIIPSLFFARGTVPDIVGESCNKWGDSASATIQYMKDFVDDFFVNLGSHKALWAIEFSNEWNLYTDLPNQELFRPGINVGKGTPAARTEADDVTIDVFQHALKVFSNQVRLHNSTIPITSGNTLPREYSFHNSKYGWWTLDSPSQSAYWVQNCESSALDMASIHLYPHHKDKLGEVTSEVLPYDDLFKRYVSSVKRAGKTTFLGEFGVSALDGTVAEVRTEFEAMMLSIYNSDISLACQWSYRFAFQSADWSVQAGTDREYQLDLIKQYNDMFLAENRLAEF